MDAEAVRADPGRTSASVTVIEVDERLPASADVAAAVDSASGVVVRRLGGLGDYAEVSIRGSSSRQVQVFLDGVPLNPDGSSSVNLSELPLAAFERVEVYRGNAPAELGAAPVGGVVNLISGDDPGTGGSVGYGAFRTSRATGHFADTIPVGGHEADVLAFAEAFGTRGDYRYFSNNGTPYEVFDDARPVRANNEKSQLSTHVRARVGDRDTIALSDAFLSRDEGVPGHMNSPATTAQLRTWRNLATLQAEEHPGVWSLSQRLWMHLREETYDDRLGEVGVGTQWDLGRTSSVGLLSHARWAATSAVTPGLTLSFRRDGYVEHDLMQGLSSPDHVRYAGAGTLAVDVWLAGEALRITPIVQVDFLDNHLLGEVPFQDAAIAPEGEARQLLGSPRLGVLLRPARGLAVKGNAGRFFRAPDFSELFGDRGGIIGNTDLRPEIGWQADLGVRYAAEAVAVELTGFGSRALDQIVFVQNGQGTSVPRNFGRAATSGVEGAATLTLPWLDVQWNATWTRARNLTETAEQYGKRLPRVPELELAQQTSVHDERLRIGHSFSYTAGNYWDATNWFLAPPRAIHGAFVRATADRVALELSVLNLLDRQIAVMDRNPLDAKDDTAVLQPLNDFFGYPLPGRAWMLTLRWTGAANPKE